jgi:hypothetical protein
MNCTVLVGCCVGVEEREEVGDCDGTSGVETREAPSKSLRPSAARKQVLADYSSPVTNLRQPCCLDVPGSTCS